MATIARLTTLIEYQIEGQQKIQSSLDAVTSKMDGVSTMAATVGQSLIAAFSVGAIVNFATRMAEFSSHMKDLSDRTGIGVERMQGLAIAADEGGVSVDTLANAMGMLSKNLVGGSPGVVEALRLMGLNLKSLLAESPDQRLFEIAKGFAAIEDPAMKAWAAQQLFGRGGNELIPILTKNLEELTKQYEKSAIPKETIERADQLEEAWHRLVVRAEALAFTAGVGLVDAISTVHLGEDDLTASTQTLTAAMAMSDSGLAGAVDQATKALQRHADALPDLTLRGVELKIVEDQLTESAKASIKAHEAQAQAAKKTADEHVRLQAILGVGHMKAAQEYAEAMAIFKSETMAFNATIDEMGEKFKNTWSKDIVVTVYDSSQVIGETLDNLARNGGLAMEHMSMTIGQAFHELFKDLGAGFSQFVDMVGQEIGGRFGQVVGDMVGAWENGKTLMKGIGKMMKGDFSGLVDTVMAGIGMIKNAWNALKGLFGGGEEGVVVNPARDKFLSQWGDPSNKGVGGAGHNLASILTELGAGEGGGAIFAALQRADTMALFRPAAQAIVSFLTEHGQSASMNFHAGGMVPGTGEVPATLLGGERVQSRGEVSDMRGMLGEFRDLKFRLLNALEVSQSTLRAQVQIQRGMGASA